MAKNRRPRTFDKGTNDTVNNDDHSSFGDGDHAGFKPKDLYALLGISWDASQETVKKAYRRLALACHPDKFKACSPSEDTSSLDEMTRKFQDLGQAYRILSTPSLRSSYDATGRIPDEDSGYYHGNGVDSPADSIDWVSYFKTIFNSVTIDAIEKVRLDYQGKPWQY